VLSRPKKAPIRRLDYMKDNSIIRVGERPRKVVSLTINRDLDLNNTPSVPFYKEQFGKNTQTKESYFFY
jgi:hypothetical protein